MTKSHWFANVTGSSDRTGLRKRASDQNGLTMRVSGQKVTGTLVRTSGAYKLLNLLIIVTGLPHPLKGAFHCTSDAPLGEHSRSCQG